MAKDGKKAAIGLGIAGLITAVVLLVTRKKVEAAPEVTSKWLIRKQQQEEIKEEIPELQIDINPVTGAVQTYDPATGTLTLNVEWEEITFAEARSRLLAKYPDLTPERYWADVALYTAYRDWRALMWTGLSQADAAEQALDYLINPDGTLTLIPPEVKEARLLWETTGMEQSFNFWIALEQFNAGLPITGARAVVSPTPYVCPIDNASFATLAEMEAYTAATYPATTSVSDMPPSVQAAIQQTATTNPTAAAAEAAWVSYVMELVPEASTDYFWTGQF